MAITGVVNVELHIDGSEAMHSGGRYVGICSVVLRPTPTSAASALTFWRPLAAASSRKSQPEHSNIFQVRVLRAT